MKINEVAQQVGITRKNIRFYEQEGLLTPNRNRENGYRDYTPEDVDTLRRIKLMRKLGVPLEEIRQMQSGRLTLGEGMRRHLAQLERQRRDLTSAVDFCAALRDNGESYSTLDADARLREIELKEKEGTAFVNKQNRDQKSRSAAAVIAAAVFALLMLGTVVMMLWINTLEPMPLWLLIVMVAIPVVFIAGVGLALVQRLKEIKGGEEDAARNY